MSTDNEGPWLRKVLDEANRSKARRMKTDLTAQLIGSASGVCIVCGSGMVIQTERGGLMREWVHCNDCGTTVTLWMHNRKQPNKKVSDGD